MPNLGGPKQDKRKLLAAVVDSQLLYASPVRCSSQVFQNHRNIILKPQRKVALRVVQAYRTVSTAAILVVAGCTPVHLAARGRGELRRLIKTGVATPVAKSFVDEKVWDWWQTEWSTEVKTGEWTRRLVKDVRCWTERKHGTVGYHLAQFLTGHGCFQQYLFRFARVAGPECVSCGHPGDSAEHTFFNCDRWYAKRRMIEMSLNRDIVPETVIQMMLESREWWTIVENYVVDILRTKENEEHIRQGVNL